MLSIDKNVIDESTSLVKCNLSYPIINEESIYSNIINLINNVIYEDIITFKDVVNDGLKVELFKLDKNILHVITEYRVTFNKSNIISIPIEFSQLTGLYEVTYVNCYNYDLYKSKNLKLNDLFNTDTDYIKLINDKLYEKFEHIVKQYSYKTTDNRFDGICNEQNFYIEKDGIVLCFSSYEISKYISHVVEFKLLFSEYEEVLSEYTINNIWI
ncbi:RsiV family protein [Romboutsia lituseburensis]|uniref:RsiV family protein n=1 Tax=Romboutsia lituseburensis TaxID=1537 RepID=UPI00215A4713|nr:RsiV family protein [Romboutsia lituseburensis]MCR8745419.1 RsiV family protein [Romboutsia lituseburensis]